jgi:hypothetical protein
MAENHSPHRFGSARPAAGGPLPDDRERIDRARQAAEALFRPKRTAAQPPLAGAGPAPHGPRILAAAAPARPATAAAPPGCDPAPEIPHTHLTRIRAWLEYGMTVSQVARVYGVAAGEIERLLRQA